MNERTAHAAMDEAADWAIKHRAQTHRVIDFPMRQRPQTSWLSGMYRDTALMWSPPFKALGRHVNWWVVLGLAMMLLAVPLGAGLYLLLQYITKAFQ